MGSSDAEFNTVTAAGRTALNQLFVLNGSSLAAGLTYSDQLCCSVQFFIGVGLSVIASGLLYVTQYAYYHMDEECIGNVANIFTIWVAILSFLMWVSGGYVFVTAL